MATCACVTTYVRRVTTYACMYDDVCMMTFCNTCMYDNIYTVYGNICMYDNVGVT